MCCLLASLVGCAGDDAAPRDAPQPSAVETFDPEGLERELKRQIEAQANSKVRMVECPTGVELEAGTSFNCIAEDRADATYTIVVTLTDDQGNLEWEITEGT